MKSAVLCLLVAVAGSAAPVITIRSAIGPNDSSGSFGAFAANAISGLQTCVGATCNVGGSLATSPTAFNQTSVFTAADMARTSYSSWRGTAPAPAGAFAGEFGNLAFWAVSVVDIAGTFSLHDLSVTQSSTDAFNYFSFSDTYGAGPGSNYAFDRIGVHFGADGALGGIDDTYYQGGENGGIQVNALYFVGIGFGFDGSVDLANNPWPGPTNQDRLNQLTGQVNALLGLDLIATCYSVGATSTCANVTLAPADRDPEPAPEPGSLALAGLALLGLGLARGRRRGASGAKR